MEKFILTLKDNSKREFLLQLLARLDFIELDAAHSKKEKDNSLYDFFKSAGLFSERHIDADQLRKHAWRIKNLRCQNQSK